MVVVPGDHVVVVRSPGHLDSTQSVAVAPGETLRVEAKLVPVPSPPVEEETLAPVEEESIAQKWWFWTSAGVVVVAVVGVVVGIAVNTGGDDFVPRASCRARAPATGRASDDAARDRDPDGGVRLGMRERCLRGGGAQPPARSERERRRREIAGDRAVEQHCDEEAAFTLGGELADGTTSLAIELEESFLGDVTIRASTHASNDGQGDVLAEAKGSFVIAPDGCNRFSLELMRRSCVDSPDANTVALYSLEGDLVDATGTHSGLSEGDTATSTRGNAAKRSASPGRRWCAVTAW